MTFDHPWIKPNVCSKFKETHSWCLKHTRLMTMWQRYTYNDTTQWWEKLKNLKKIKGIKKCKGLWCVNDILFVFKFIKCRGRNPHLCSTLLHVTPQTSTRCPQSVFLVMTTWQSHPPHLFPINQSMLPPASWLCMLITCNNEMQR